MKTLIADKFSETHLARLSQLGCEVTYKPNAKAEELPALIAPFKILVVRGKQVTAETLKASDQLALVLRAGAGVNTIDVKTASARGVLSATAPARTRSPSPSWCSPCCWPLTAASRRTSPPCARTSGTRRSSPRPTGFSARPSA